MVGTDSIATVRDCPTLNKLMPFSFQKPPIEAANEKQKQSANPTKKDPKYTRKINSISKPT